MAKVSPAQRDVVRRVLEGDKSTLVLAGATRSGKTFVAAMAHACWIALHGGGHDHLLAGRTAGTAWRNAGDTLVGFLRAFGCKVKANMARGFIYADTPSGRARIWIVGANDVQSRTKLQGATLQSAHVDEAPLCHPGFWPMLEARLSEHPVRLIATLNPESPAHWFKRDVIDAADPSDTDVLTFTFEDNPVLSEPAKARIRARLSGHWYARLVLGEWAGAAGLILPDWKTTDVPVEDEGAYWNIGLDWGPATTTCALLMKCRAVNDGHWGAEATVMDELVHDARDTSTITQTVMLDKLVRWIAAHGLKPEHCRIYVDPATAADFQLLLHGAGFGVIDGDNDVLPGLSTTHSRLASGNVKLLKGACPRLEKELHVYSWDSTAQGRGEDRPRKTADHCIDALRYWAYTCAQPDPWADWYGDEELDPEEDEV